MHGSPLSRYDNKLIWKKYDYKEHGVVGEPYLDIDYSSVSYLTDTGRSWGNSVSVRDVVSSRHRYNFNHTKDIIENINDLSNNTIFTLHPERWSNQPLEWAKSFLTQKIKNTIKFFILKTNYYKGY